MEIKVKEKRKGRKMKKWHKWVGLFFTFFIFMFAVSGIFLNHRRAISSIDVPRSVLGSNYHYNNWNNGAVKGGFRLSTDSILLYGGNGIWLTNSEHSDFTPFVSGIKKGADNNIINNIQETSSGEIFAVSTFGLYQLNSETAQWENLSEIINTKERFVDIAVQGDSLVLMTRSHLYISRAPYTAFDKIELSAPEGYKKESSLFRTMWTLHSGELFGLPGKIFVDLLGGFTIILCITGLILFFKPGIIKKKLQKEKNIQKNKSLFKTSLKWHNKLGVWFLVFFLILTVSGMFLRPPLLIAIVRSKTKPIPGTMLDSNNPWHDKLRCLRYDKYDNEWIIYSSEGFFRAKSFDSAIIKLKKSPPVSVMGVNVFHQQDSLQWIVGSFNGLYMWNKNTGESLDLYTGKAYEHKQRGIPTFSNAISGYCDLFEKKTLIFEYGKGVKSLGTDEKFTPMPDAFHEARMSLWHLSLEIHVGRIYAFIPGIIADLFVFISGVLFLIILITGYVVYRRYHKKRKLKGTKSISDLES